MCRTTIKTYTSCPHRVLHSTPCGVSVRITHHMQHFTINRDIREAIQECHADGATSAFEMHLRGRCANCVEQCLVHQIHTGFRRVSREEMVEFLRREEDEMRVLGVGREVHPENAEIRRRMELFRAVREEDRRAGCDEFVSDPLVGTVGVLREIGVLEEAAVQDGTDVLEEEDVDEGIGRDGKAWEFMTLGIGRIGNAHQRGGGDVDVGGGDAAAGDAAAGDAAAGNRAGAG